MGAKYEVIRQLDEGGMGVILEAEHVFLNERFAVKMLSPLFASDPDVFARFRREAAVTARLDHPHIVKVIDCDMADAEEAYLVLELLRGETLRDRLTRGPVRPEDAVRIVAQLASALAAVHSAGIVHRDVKPSNVFLVDGEGEGDRPFVKLLDFGVCKELRPAAQRSHLRFLVGTPDYMAPEQASGRSEGVDARTDQHALALVAYEMLTGHQPFAHRDLSEVFRRVATVEPAPASSIASALPVAVDAVLARALSKDPGNRFEDVGAFARALAMALETGDMPEAPMARPDTPVEDGPVCAPTLPSVVPPPQAMERAARSGAVSVRHSAAARACVDVPPSVAPALSPPAAGDDAAESMRRIGACLEKARTAFTFGAPDVAVAFAEMALRLGEFAEDPITRVVLEASEPLLARIFLHSLGSRGQKLFKVVPKDPDDVWMPARSAYLLHRIEDSMTVGELLDTPDSSRVETLRDLVHLVSTGVVRAGSEGSPC